jgi:hypothetical protein
MAPNAYRELCDHAFSSSKSASCSRARFPDTGIVSENGVSFWAVRAPDPTVHPHRVLTLACRQREDHLRRWRRQDLYQRYQGSPQRHRPRCFHVSFTPSTSGWLITNRPSSFPQSVAHGIQALDDGLEILLMFSDGDFDATGTTFMLSDWLVHAPREIVAQNLGLSIADLQRLPTTDPYIFRSSVPPPQEGHADEQAKVSPDGDVPNPLVFSLSEQDKELAPGGWAKIQDSTRGFPASWAATAYVYLEPGALRELHWHVDEGAVPSPSSNPPSLTPSRMALHHFWSRKGHRFCRRVPCQDL